MPGTATPASSTPSSTATARPSAGRWPGCRQPDPRGVGMKVYISADIEGIAGITDWEEATKTHGTYGEFREEMTNEVVAACEGAITAGATEILIKDAHGTGRNIIASRLPD